MSYINPYELLGINETYLSDVDSKTVLREKKKLLHEIDLSDSYSILHNGIELTKADCLTAVDDLDDKSKREFHFFIFQHNSLNKFLTNGSLAFFERYQIESIYKLPEFLDFISPYFASQYDKILTDNFKKNNIEAVKKILSVKPITNQLFFEACYKGTYSILKNLDAEINGITKQIEIKQSPFINDNFNGLDSLIKNKVEVDIINLLPVYFQSLRNQLAQSIRNLARDINNEPYNLYEPAYKIIEIAKGFSTDGLINQTITKGYYVIKKNYEDGLTKQPQPRIASTPSSQKPILDEDEEQIINEPTIDKETKDTSSKKIFAGFLLATSCLFVWAFFNSTVQKVILTLATLLYISWFYNKTKTPENYIKEPKGLTFVYGLSFMVCIGGFFSPVLSILFVSYFLIIFLHLFYTTLTSKKPPGAISGIIYLVLAIGITLGWYYENQEKLDVVSVFPQEQSSSPKSKNLIPPFVRDTSTANSSNRPIVHDYALEKNILYAKIQMENGNISNCLGITPKYDYSIKTKLIISAESIDAAVKIFDYETNKCIRFVFVNNGSTYTVKYIPEGNYYLKIAYGNNWSVLKGFPTCKGSFRSNVSYKKDNDIYDFNKKYYKNGDVSTPYYTLKLYRAYTSDNLENISSQNSISENDFNSN